MFLRNCEFFRIITRSLRFSYLFSFWFSEIYLIPLLLILYIYRNRHQSFPVRYPNLLNHIIDPRSGKTDKDVLEKVMKITKRMHVVFSVVWLWYKKILFRGLFYVRNRSHLNDRNAFLILSIEWRYLVVMKMCYTFATEKYILLMTEKESFIYFKLVILFKLLQNNYHRIINICKIHDNLFIFCSFSL